MQRSLTKTYIGVDLPKDWLAPMTEDQIKIGSN